MCNCPWQLRWEQADEAIRLLHVTGDLGEVTVWRHANGAAKSGSNIFVDRLLNVEGDLTGAGRLLLAAHELADHLID